jgi:spore coat polysaccharide biosynthesis protein SpsF
MTALPKSVVAVVQARLTSTRLPGKIMKLLAGAPLIRRCVERVARIRGVDAVVVALAAGSEHDAVLDALKGFNAMIVRGPEDDVLARTAAAARAAGAATVMRITSDCPLIDPAVSAAVLQAYLTASRAGIRYARTAFDEGFPLGFDTEVFGADLLDEAEAAASDPYEREHVTPYIWRRPDKFPSVIVSGQPNRRHWRLVVDTMDDYRLASAVYDALYPENPQFGFADLCHLFAARPELLQINTHVQQRPYVGLSHA